MGNWATKSTGGTLTATEFNLVANEIENAETAGSETPSAGSSDQLGKAITNIAANGDYYTDSGAADAYVLSVISPNNSPTALRNGMRCRFRTTNANTGASTVNVAGLGVKSIKLQDGTTDPATGQIADDRENVIVYDTTNFRLVSSGIELDSTSAIKGISYLQKPITLANGTDTDHDIDFGTGVFDFSDYSGQATLTATTKRIDASWAAGSGNGGLFTGSVGNNTWYYLFAIYNPTTGVSDAGFDTSVTAANAPAGYTKYRRLGAVLTNGSANILNGTWTGNYFEFIEPINNLTDAAPAVASANQTVSIPPITNIKAYVKAIVSIGLATGDILNVAFGKKTETLLSSNLDIYERGDSVTTSETSCYKHIPCTDGQIKYQVFSSTNTRTLKFYTYGYTDYNL